MQLLIRKSVYSVCLGVLCSPPQSAVQIKYLVSSAWFSFFPGIHNAREKSHSTIIFKLSSFQRYKFCCQGHLIHFLENYDFCQKSGNDA